MMQELETGDCCPTCGKILQADEKQWMNCDQCGGFPIMMEFASPVYFGSRQMAPGRYVVRRGAHLHFLYFDQNPFQPQFIFVEGQDGATGLEIHPIFGFVFSHSVVPDRATKH